MAMISNAVQRPTPPLRPRQSALVHSFGLNSRAPFDPPKALCAVLMKSLRESRRARLEPAGETISDRRPASVAQGVGVELFAIRQPLCSAAAAAYIRGRDRQA